MNLCFHPFQISFKFNFCNFFKKIYVMSIIECFMQSDKVLLDYNMSFGYSRKKKQPNFFNSQKIKIGNWYRFFPELKRDHVHHKRKKDKLKLGVMLVFKDWNVKKHTTANHKCYKPVIMNSIPPLMPDEMKGSFLSIYN